jgi:hypothetical protein
MSTVKDWRDITKGDWLFTCRMEPVQFRRWLYDDLGPDNPDDFETLDGSCHSRLHCSLKPVSTAYGEWFKANRMEQYYDFFLTEHVSSLSQWRAISDKSRYCYRETPNGVKYWYKKRVGGAKQFAYLSFGTFMYRPPEGSHFSIRQDIWDVYAAYLRHRAYERGIEYEGY